MARVMDTVALAREELKSARAGYEGRDPNDLICLWVERWADGMLDAAAVVAQLKLTRLGQLLRGETAT